MKLDHSYVKQVQNTLFFCALCLIWPFGFALALSEPVKIQAPASSTSEDAEPSRVIYDQRQTGKYNIHLSIKDVAIIEMDQNEIEDMNYNEDDYYYDEGHLTVKPILLSPISALNKPNQTVSSTRATTTTLITPEQEQIASTSPTSPTLNILSNRTSFSPNLLADVAATHAATNDHVNANTTSTSPSTPLKRTQSVVILDGHSSTHSSPTSTHKPATSTSLDPAAESSARSKDTPIQSALQEPLLHPKQHLNGQRLPPRPYFRFIDAAQPNADADQGKTDQQPDTHENDSRIFKFKVRRAHRGGNGESVHYPSPVSKCRANQFRDINGNCRAKRSSSLLKKLFSMLITLPFANERAIGDRDDE